MCVAFRWKPVFIDYTTSIVVVVVVLGLEVICFNLRTGKCY